MICTDGGGVVTFAPGLTTSRSFQTVTLVADKFGLDGCSVSPSREVINADFEGASVTFPSMDCIVSATNGDGHGRIRWSNEKVSDVTIRMSLSGTPFGATTGSMTLTVDDGFLSGARGTAAVSGVQFSQRGVCENPVVKATIKLATLTMGP
jgi:hypothetical protein